MCASGHIWTRSKSTKDRHVTLMSLFQTHEQLNVLSTSRQQYDWSLHKHLNTAHSHRHLCILLCNKRGQSILSHWKIRTKRPKWNWQTGGGVTGLKLICAPSLLLSHIVSRRTHPPSIFFSHFLCLCIYTHTFPVEVILKTRFGPIKLKLYSPSCGCLIESDIDTITTDKLD